MSNEGETAAREERVALACSSERFTCRFSQGMFAWNYCDAGGRLLVAGPAHADLWQAHRLLLAAIQEEATAGLSNAADEEEGAGCEESTPSASGRTRSTEQSPTESAA